MQVIYPSGGSVVSLSTQIGGTPGKRIGKVASLDSAAELLGHLDGACLGSTRNIYQLALQPSHSCHTLTVVNNAGNSISVAIVVV